jgi:glycosyltransferase involved in cell wall biosynthesis
MKVALMGTRGVPARYGGFETAVEEVGARLASRGHQVVVYCRNRDQNLKAHRGMRLINLPAVRRRVAETLSHSALSAVHAAGQRFDCAIVFNAANAPVLPMLRMPLAVHVDGLEWRRAKWSGRAAQYLRWSERTAVRRADAVIADARGIQDYLLAEYKRSSVFIPYGAPILRRGDLKRPATADVDPKAFHLVVARLEPENNVDVIVEAYLKSDLKFPLVVVGDNPYPSEYVSRCIARLGSSPRVRWLGALWNQDELDWYYANCLSYIHGHTVGGTNPSLLRAMGAAAPVVAMDVSFNREVCGKAGRFFDGGPTLTTMLADHEAMPTLAQQAGARLQRRAADHYCWDQVAEAYERLCIELAESGG